MTETYDPQRSLQIDTPENLLLEAEIAGFGSRCVAAIYDYLYLGFIMVIVGMIVSQFFQVINADENLLAALFILIQFALISFYHLFFEFGWNGQTPGKRRVGIRVVQTNGLPLSASAVLVRNLVRLFDFFPLLYGAGLVVMFANKRVQRLGDLAAGTVVVREQKEIRLEDVGENLMLIYKRISLYRPLPEYIQIDNLDVEDRRAIVSYLQRRDEFVSIDHLAPALARNVAGKIGTPEALKSVHRQIPELNEVFLEQVALAFEIADQAQRGDQRPTAANAAD